MDAVHCVYVLRDPQDFRVKYVGCTKRPVLRKRFHRTRHAHPTMAVQKWTNILGQGGEKAVFEVVAQFSDVSFATPAKKRMTASSMAHLFEETLIRTLRNSGCVLLNADMDEVRRHAKK